MSLLKQIGKLVPTLLTAFLLALVVWVSAVSSNDPNQEVNYINPIPVQILGQNPDLLITEQNANSVMVTIKAPRSVHTQLSSDPDLISATVNLSDIQAGVHELTPEVSIGISPAQVIRVTPATLEFTLENVVSLSYPVQLNLTGSLPSSYESGPATLSSENVQVVGPESKVSLITDIVVTLDLTNITNSISRSIDLRPQDANGNFVDGVTLNPSRVTVEIPVEQLAGYQNVFLKIVTEGTPASGYHLTGLMINPPNITIYASDPSLVNEMPKLISTLPINLTGASESIETIVGLDLPEGIEVVGNTDVIVQVKISPIISSDPFYRVPVSAINLRSGLTAVLTPTEVDLILTGPISLLELINPQTLLVTVDLQGLGVGTHQVKPTLSLDNLELQLDFISPDMIEVVIQ